MTAKQIIDELDAAMPNAYTTEDKLRWLNEIDGRVWLEIFGTHELNDGEELPEEVEYTLENMDTVEALIGKPFADVYFYWLQSKIHYRNQEFNYYENTSAMFNSAWRAYANHYRRTHVPVQVGRKWF